MSRRRLPSGATISLFPFLAVLLCTMGALLVLLVIFSRRAHESDTAAARAAEAARVEEMELARDEFAWRLERLRDVRERTTADLARERMRLAGVEEDARRLADEIDALERTAEALERDDPGAGAAVAVADAERRLAAARTVLEEARATGRDKPAAYAVVPYAGANGTHRRPLYVECCIDGVFLQPEGIRLGPADFEGPPGPGNPLACGLRAAREHLARGPAESGDPTAQPYPLLLVRPAGVMAYYAAREALASWGSEFGYQFVDEDWQLKYPPADPALAAAEQRAVDESRRRMEWLAQTRPARPTRPTRQYRAATSSGGVVADGGPTVLGDQSRFDWTEEQAGAGPRRGNGGGAGGAGDDRPGGDVVLGGGGGGRGVGVAGRGEQGGGSGPGNAAADRYAGPSRFYSGNPTGDAAGEGSVAGGVPGGTGGPHTAGGVRGRAGATGDPWDPSLAGVASDGGGSGGDAGAGREGSGSGSGASAGGGGSTAGAGSPGFAGAAAAGAGAGGTSGGPALPGMPQGAGATASVGAAGSASGSLAGKRGSNWASLATAERPVPLTRPIRVECAAHEFRILDDGGTRVEKRIPIGTRTADSVDPLVQAVHARVAGWGLAGERMYWRPELVLAETADGASRREDLERLLTDSGIDTRRGQADTQVRPLPPVARATAASGRR